MLRPTKVKAIVFVPLIVLATVSLFFALGYLATIIFRIPISLDMPLPARFFGLLLIALGLFFLGWLFRYRKLIDLVVSTYVTLVKAVRRIPLSERSDRTEPLIIMGPYQYVRHPLYFSVFIVMLGWWILLDYTFLLFSALLLSFWFSFVVIPFEERELVEIFGSQYKSYEQKVPSLIPLTKRHKTNEPK